MKHGNRWKGDKVGYQGIHQWLNHIFGYPSKCEKCNKIGSRSKNNRWTINWAKLKRKKYKRKRENFWALCKSCHTSYDIKKDTGKKISLSNLGKKVWNKCKTGIYSKKTLKKMSMAKLGNHYRSRYCSMQNIV